MYTSESLVVKLGFAFDIPREDDTRSAVVEVQRVVGWVGGSFLCVGEPRPSKIGGRAAAAARMQGAHALSIRSPQFRGVAQ